MNPIIMDGKALADKIAVDLKQRVDKLKEKGVQPELIIFTASKDPASKIYVRNKIKRAEEIGIKVEHIVKDKLTRETMEYVHNRNVPCIVQMPFCSTELTVDDLRGYVSGYMDVDGFLDPYNLACIAMGKEPYHYPCTPKGVVELLKEYGVELKGKSVCMIGRSQIVGLPLALMLMNENATVTVCHSKTDYYTLVENLFNADIVISATGKPEILEEVLDNYCNTDDYPSLVDIMSDKIVVDVGVSRVDGHIVGDVPQEVKELCKMYTPSVGGVGPLTVISLLDNTVRAYEKEYNR